MYKLDSQQLFIVAAPLASRCLAPKGIENKLYVTAQLHQKNCYGGSISVIDEK